MPDQIGRKSSNPPRIPYERYEAQPAAREGGLKDLAHEVLEAVRADMPEQYAELVEAYDGQAAVVGVFGMGSVTVAVTNKEVLLDPAEGQRPPLLARAATYPEVLTALGRGNVTVLDAFHRGDLVVQADEAEELHRAYDFIVRFSDEALRSERLRGLLDRFERQAG